MHAVRDRVRCDRSGAAACLAARRERQRLKTAVLLKTVTTDWRTADPLRSVTRM